MLPTYLLGTAYLRLHNTKLAEENYAKALEMRQELAAKDPANLQKQEGLHGKPGACGFHEAAVKNAEEIHKQSPKDAGTLLDLVRCYALCSVAVEGRDEIPTPTAGQAKLHDVYAAKAANCLEQAIPNGLRNVVDVETDLIPTPSGTTNRSGMHWTSFGAPYGRQAPAPPWRQNNGKRRHLRQGPRDKMCSESLRTRNSTRRTFAQRAEPGIAADERAVRPIDFGGVCHPPGAELCVHLRRIQP